MFGDSFIREVNSDIRNAYMQTMWLRYRWFIIGFAALIILVTISYRGWSIYSQAQAEKSGDAFVAATALSNDGKTSDAIAAFEKIVNSGSGNYPVLAKLMVAGIHEVTGDWESSVSKFDEISSDKSIPKTYRQVAQLRSGLILVDHRNHEEVSKRLRPLADSENSSFYHLAREALGLAAWKTAHFVLAKKWYSMLAEDKDLQPAALARVKKMLVLLKQNTDAQEDGASQESNQELNTGINVQQP